MIAEEIEEIVLCVLCHAPTGEEMLLVEEDSPYSNRRLRLWPWSLPSPWPCAVEPIDLTLVAPDADDASLFSEEQNEEEEGDSLTLLLLLLHLLRMP